jgi:hypothetical protein
MKVMKRCKEVKRLQIYMDGWMDPNESIKFEKHLQKCSFCQTELMTLEEMSSAAIEIPDEAPEREYWDSFHSRIMNRIIARDISPHNDQISESRKSKLKIGSYSLVIVSLAAVMVILLNVNINTPLNEAVTDNQQNPNTDSVLNVIPPQIIDKNNAEVANIIVNLDENMADTEVSNNDVIPSTNIPEQPINSELVLASVENDVSPIDTEINYSDLLDDRFVLSSVPVQLTERDKNLDNYPRVFEGRINEKYQLKPEIVASGIFSLVDNTSEASRSMAFQNMRSNTTVSGNFISDRGGFNVNWGYLSMPGEISKTDEYERYLIEIELIEIK